MQQAQDLIQCDFSLPVYENLIVSLVNVSHFLRGISNYALSRGYYRFAFCKHQGAVCSCICIVLEKFWSQDNSFKRNIYVILAKFALQN